MECEKCGARHWQVRMTEKAEVGVCKICGYEQVIKRYKKRGVGMSF